MGRKKPLANSVRRLSVEKRAEESWELKDIAVDFLVHDDCNMQGATTASFASKRKLPQDKSDSFKNPSLIKKQKGNSQRSDPPKTDTSKKLKAVENHFKIKSLSDLPGDGLIVEDIDFVIELVKGNDTAGLVENGIGRLLQDGANDEESLNSTLRFQFGKRNNRLRYRPLLVCDRNEKCLGEVSVAEDSIKEAVMYLISKNIGKIFFEKIKSVQTSTIILHGAFHIKKFFLEGDEVFSDEIIQANATNRSIKALMRFKYPQLEEINDGSSQSKGFLDVGELYANIKPDNSTVPQFTNPLGLLPTLRPYQKRAVLWMIERETCLTSSPYHRRPSFIPNGVGVSCREEGDESLHPMWVESMDLAGKAFYYNPYSGRLTRKRFHYPKMDEIRGGILADEMGLGKTVEVLACVLSNPATPSFLSSPVEGTESGNALLVNSKATLIISPSSISRQWKSEIFKHIDKRSLNVKIYEGMGVEGHITPEHLASYDIVITTYEALRSDIYHCGLGSNTRVLRYEKKYEAKESPLPLIHWWRVCLDEAQMVESKTSNCARMALKLSCWNRWCVSGTTC